MTGIVIGHLTCMKKGPMNSELTRYFFLKLCKVTWAWMLKSDYLKTEFLIAGNHIKVRDPKMWCPKIPFLSLGRFWFSRYRGKKFLTKSEYRIL